MNRNDNVIIRAVDMEDNIIFDKKPTALPLKEELIISDSIKFFNDPEPCMIHRSAVMKRIYLNIIDSLWKLVKDDMELSWSIIPDSVKNYLDIKDEIKYIRIIKDK
ncbi:hypothetical protein OXPF_41830 [Oxobacter pfennigii]|uniref:Uncharacterized protein n=1 Tax=Oxobacter pfennigii TaxID=36849 RepID=A0A0P8W440_9CLOT|nr:hypothetical protein [Oxobacter pfennigii]KPU42398.1 hypothetical protein OXPF_41830 [Oxobacter pfennigii]